MPMASILSSCCSAASGGGGSSVVAKSKTTSILVGMIRKNRTLFNANRVLQQRHRFTASSSRLMLQLNHHNQQQGSFQSFHSSHDPTSTSNRCSLSSASPSLSTMLEEEEDSEDEELNVGQSTTTTDAKNVATAKPTGSESTSSIDTTSNSTSTTSSFHPGRHYHWSLQELANINRWDDPKVQDIIQDVALRLQFQLQQLQTLEDYIQTIRKQPKLTICRNSLMTRPYWWTHVHENQLMQEIQTQQSQIKNLQRLYQDTHQQIQQFQKKNSSQQQLQSNQSSSSSSNYNTNKTRYLLFKLFGEIYARHALTIETFAELVIGLRPLQQPPEIQDLIQMLLQERLGMLLLCDHISALCNTKQSSSLAVMNADISDIVQKAVTEARLLCEAHYLTVPPVHIQTRSSTSSSNISNTLLVKPWLQYTLVELLKNSMAITVERNRNHCTKCSTTNTATTKNSSNDQEKSNDPNAQENKDEEENSLQLCPIHIVIRETSHSIWIQIHDQGGGIKAEKIKSLFTFAQRRTKWDRMDDQQTYAMTRSPLRGLGVGLSMSRMMMEYFGGSLDLQDHSASSSSSSDDDDDSEKIKVICNDDDEQQQEQQFPVDENVVQNETNVIFLEQGATATIIFPKDTTIPEKL